MLMKDQQRLVKISVVHACNLCDLCVRDNHVPRLDRSKQAARRGVPRSRAVLETGMDAKNWLCDVVAAIKRRARTNSAFPAGQLGI